jgi:hypothetical protein
VASVATVIVAAGERGVSQGRMLVRRRATVEELVHVVDDECKRQSDIDAECGGGVDDRCVDVGGGGGAEPGGGNGLGVGCKRHRRWPPWRGRGAPQGGDGGVDETGDATVGGGQVEDGRSTARHVSHRRTREAQCARYEVGETGEGGGRREGRAGGGKPLRGR